MRQAMKLPANSAEWAQASVSIAFTIAFTVLIIFSHNGTVITFSIGAIAVIYAHWLPSPSQQSSINSLVQQITPILTSLLAKPAPTTSDTTQPLKAVHKEQAPL